MFVEPPEGFEDCFGFVYDSEFFGWEDDGGWGEGVSNYMGAIVVSTKTKLVIERIIGQILNLRKVELPINNKFGLIIENVIAGIHHGHINLGDSVNDEVLRRILIDLDDLHEKESCPDFCICKFSDKERIWGHHLYHLLLRGCAKEIGIAYSSLISDYTNYKHTTIQKVSEYLSKNDWDIKKGIAEEEGAVGFILLSILQNYREFFRVGHVNHLKEEILVDKNSFNDCINGECKYNNNYYPIWQSESVIQTIEEKVNWPDSPYGLRMDNDEEWFGDRSKMRQKVVERPLATVHQRDCICSGGKYYFGLYINKFVEGNVERQCVRDSKDEAQLSDNEAIDMLVSEYYGRFLPKKQAELAAKLTRRQYYQNDRGPLNEKERNSKFLLRKTIEKMENIVSHRPDIKHLSERISKTKSFKKKGGDNLAKSGKGPVNGPSKTGNPSGKGRGNNLSKK